MARQNTSAPPANTIPPTQDSSYIMSIAQGNPAQQAAAMNQTLPFPPIPPPVNVPAAAATFAQPSLQGPNVAQNFASNPFVPQQIIPPANLDPTLQQQLLLIKALADQGIPTDRIPEIIRTMMSGQGPSTGIGGTHPPAPMQFAAQNQNQILQTGWSTRSDESRDRNGYPEPVRSPQGRFGGRRSRSRSPRAWNSRDSPASRRLEEQNFEYDRESPGRNRGDDRGRGRGGRGNDYRQRSPPRRGRSPTPPRSNGNANKWIGHDATLGQGKIKGM